MILGRFSDFQSDRTPPEPMNLLCISMVWGAFGRPGVRRGLFSIFMKILRNFIKFMKFMKIHEISREFIKSLEFLENVAQMESHEIFNFSVK